MWEASNQTSLSSSKSPLIDVSDSLDAHAKVDDGHGSAYPEQYLILLVQCSTIVGIYVVSSIEPVDTGVTEG